MFRPLIFAILLVFAGSPPTVADESLLPAEEAFVLTAEAVSDNLISVRWQIADGYYMYRDKLGVDVDGHNIVLGKPRLPEGRMIQDALFGEVETYTGEVVLDIPVNLNGTKGFSLIAKGQGCNKPVGVCYPPMERSVDFTLTEVEEPEESMSLFNQPGASGQSTLDSAGDLRAMLAQGFQDQEFLEVDEAFKVNFSTGDDGELLASFRIADGYYLYKDKVGFQSNGRPPIGAVTLPDGTPKTDEYFGEVTVFEQDFRVPVVLSGDTQNIDGLVLDAEYQGCAVDGICYSPVVATFEFTGLTGTSPQPARFQTGVEPVVGKAVATANRQGGGINSGVFGEQIDARRMSLSLFGSALFAGLLLTFTPCVLPMIPILSGVIAGQGNSLTKSRGGILAATYVLGTAVTYASMGALAGATGDQLQAYFQNIWAIGILSALFFVMALSMFGLFEIQMPSFIQSRVHGATGNLGGSIPLVFLLGLFSALIIGACVSPILITFLGVAVTTGNAVMGAQLMVAMALGMGVPLILLGFGAGHFLPRAGVWMERIKHGFGILLVAVSIYLLGSLPQVPVLFLWGAFFVFLAVYLGATSGFSASLTGWDKLCRGTGVILLVWGVMALIGGFMGERNVFRPIPSHLISPSDQSVVIGQPQSVEFIQVRNMDQLDQEIVDAASSGKKVMVDYYADWCVDCVRMEESTFRNPKVVALLDQDFLSLQIDVTDPGNEEGKALKKAFGVFGPPATIFLDTDGRVIPGSSFYGYKDSDAFYELISGLDTI